MNFVALEEEDELTDAEPVAEAGAPDDRALAAWEIASVVAAALIAEWVVLSLAGRSKVVILVPVAFAFVFILVSHRLRRETPRELGWRLDNFLEATRLLILPMLVGTVVCLCIGWLNGGLSLRLWQERWAVVLVATVGIAWGLVQQ